MLGAGALVGSRVWAGSNTAIEQPAATSSTLRATHAHRTLWRVRVDACQGSVQRTDRAFPRSNGRHRGE
jgi:hypothetical protein